MRKASLAVSGLPALSLVALTTLVTLAGALAACSSESPPTLGTNRDGGGGGGGGGGGSEVDARRPYPSFRDDVAPIVQESCALTACHSSRESNLGILLTYDTAQIYDELQKTSPTASGEKFVVAGDPARSYLMVKLEGTQQALAAKCPNGSCGTIMPPDTKLPAAQLETVRAWIAAGAKDN